MTPRPSPDDAARARAEQFIEAYVASHPNGFQIVDALLTFAAQAAQRAFDLLDIETLRRYHELSFADPPSYHTPDVSDLWDCGQCIERFIERATEALRARHAATKES